MLAPRGMVGPVTMGTQNRIMFGESNAGCLAIDVLLEQLLEDPRMV